MLKKLISGFVTLSMLFSSTSFVLADDVTLDAVTTPRKMEYLKRGAFGAYVNGGVYLSWRLLGNEPMDTKFNVYRDGKLITEEGGINRTNYTDDTGSQFSKYQISAVNSDGQEQSLSDYVPILQGRIDNGYDGKKVPYAYFDIPIQAPPTDGLCKYYDANDASVGDLDGDGEYEVILKWDPDNSKDNSGTGITGNVYIDAYKMSGKRLWRINLGRNIRAGAHYTQFMVYDFDSDGKAEIAVKTAPGSTDSKGTYVTAVGNTETIRKADNNADYIDKGTVKKGYGHILSGPEYLTVFDSDGIAKQTIDYKPGRGNVSAWGDPYANRADRMLAGVAYLDGINPYIVMCRGYYTRVAIAAYRWDGTNLEEKYYYDTGSNKSDPVYGQGNHQISVADLNNDGLDEIIYGSAALKVENGNLVALHGMGYGHGDALHVSDFDNDGNQEIFGVLEEGQHGTNLREGDGVTDKWRDTAEGDTGRGLMAVVSEKYKAIGWSSQYGDKAFLAPPKDGKPQTVPMAPDKSVTPNFAIYWDGDLLREFADGDKIDKWYDNDNSEGGYIKRHWTISAQNPIASNNYTKKNPCLQADLFGDWREEYVLRLADNSALRVFTSLEPTEHKFTTFMHDSQYRCAVAWQNTGYNQPPHQSYYIGPDMELPAQPNIDIVAPYQVSFNINDQEGNPVSGISVEIDGAGVGATGSNGKITAVSSLGEHTYSIKGNGYERIGGEESFTITADDKDNIKEINIQVKEKENAVVSVSYKSNDGKILKETENLGTIPTKNSYKLDDSKKENITVDGVIYEYNPNLSSDTSFDNVLDDIEIQLVFDKNTLPGNLGTEIFRTNFSKDGFSKDNENHGYSINEGVSPSYGISERTKFANYNTDDGLTIELPDSYDKFVAEFDMAYFETEGTNGGTAFGLTLCSGTTEGDVVGVRNTGSKEPHFCISNGTNTTSTPSYTSGKQVDKGKMYRYVLECTGDKLILNVGDKTTGQIVDTLSFDVNDSIKSKIDTLKFKNLSKGFSGSANLGLSDLRVYQIGGPNVIEWPVKDSNVTLNIPSSLSIKPTEAYFKTGIDSYRIDVSDKPITYEISNPDGTPVGEGVSIDADGLITIGDKVQKSNYKVTCKCGDEVIKAYDIQAIKSGNDSVYDSTSEDADVNFFKYNKPSETDTAKWTASKNKWTLEQADGLSGGREFYADFLPESRGGKATLKFKMNSKPNQLKPAEEGQDQKSYSFAIQFLDADYKEGENPDEHVNIGLQQQVDTKVKELEFYGKAVPASVVKNDSNLVHLKDDGTFVGLEQNETANPNITARTSTVWQIIVDFDFDRNLASLAVINGDDRKNEDGSYKNAGYGYGYKYDNIPISNGFKTLRFITEGDVSADDVTLKSDGTTQPMLKLENISNVSYSRYIFEPEDIDASTIKLEGGFESISLSFEEPAKNYSSVVYTASLFNADDTPATDADGNILEQKSNILPIVFDNIAPGEYNYKVKISAQNSLGEIGPYNAGPFDITIVKSAIEANVENENADNGQYSFNAVVNNTTNTALDGVVVASLYSGEGKLIASDYKPVNVVSGEAEIPFNFEIKEINSFTVKLFIWDSIEDMKPILKRAFSKEVSTDVPQTSETPKTIE